MWMRELRLIVTQQWSCISPVNKNEILAMVSNNSKIFLDN